MMVSFAYVLLYSPYMAFNSPYMAFNSPYMVQGPLHSIFEPSLCNEHVHDVPSVSITCVFR